MYTTDHVLPYSYFGYTCEIIIHVGKQAHLQCQHRKDKYCKCTKTQVNKPVMLCLRLFVLLFRFQVLK